MKKRNENTNEKNNKNKSKSKEKNKRKKNIANNSKKEKQEYILSLVNIKEIDQPVNLEKNEKLQSKEKNLTKEEIKMKESKEEEKENNNEENKNDIDNYINEINSYLVEEKENFIKEEDIIGVDIQKKKNKKVNTIEVDENQENYIQQFLPKNNNVVEVKDKIFKINEEIPKEIYYEGKLFLKDRHQGKLNTNEINYRCKNNRKDERIRNTAFCNALIKRKKNKKTVYYILETQHSKECNELFIINKKIETNLIGNYNDFINKCFAFLDSTEIYNKNEFSVKLLQIYNEIKTILN